MRFTKWGILSTANIAQTQLIPAIERFENAEVTAIASGSGRASEVARELGIPKSYDCYEGLLVDPEIEAVYIPLPNHLHKKWVIEAAKKGKHILCEKPAVLTSADMEDIQRTCEENNVLFMEGFMYYFHQQHDRVKEIIASGEIGDVKLVRSSFSFLVTDKEDNIRMDAAKGGGTFYDIGCYSIHSIRHILGSEPVAVHVHAKRDATYGVETNAVTYMEFSGEIMTVFDNSFESAFRQEYEIIGTEGRVTVPRAYRPDLNGGDGLVIVETDGVRREETINTDQYKAEVEHFSDAILTGVRLKHTMQNTVSNLKVIDACLQSIETGEKVYLN
ncbi:Gfo/Idh/MocA family protein [Lentibacillus amyloliquefaciens]|uniref:Oxidoreductase n=1 Tax=Lentibacillus amyloliquefaciens TaxID=1472767 RepID=A0A0U3NTT4_9BACI|nr:Gfo/Idh/MocA family oxidoreductase [Lentibacillus amyloliquefaciens]ALX50011.1 oxidoreductase [Lentibacillus amyloliquefaciens]